MTKRSRTPQVLPAALSLALVACGGADEAPPIDASTIALDGHSVIDAAPIDAVPPDAAACQPALLLDPAEPLADQGWAESGFGGAVAIVDGQVEIDTLAAKTADIRLLSLSGGVPATGAFAIEFELTVDEVQAHNQYDAAVALFGWMSTPDPVGDERYQMIYLDAGQIGWGDDAGSYAVDTTVERTYRLEVEADGDARVLVDGTEALTRTGFMRNGTLGFGDQTNDPATDATFRVRRVERLCP